jgi:hypothetical protein
VIDGKKRSLQLEAAASLVARATEGATHDASVQAAPSKAPVSANISPISGGIIK